MLLPRRLWQLAFAQIPQKQYSPHPWIIFPWIKDHQTCYYIVSFFCHLSQPVDTSSISRFPPTSLTVECLCPSATTAGLRELCTQSSAGKHGFRFNTFFVSCFGAKKLWAAEFWVSFHRTNPSKCSTGSAASSPRKSLEAAQNRQKIKMHCQAFIF